MRVQTGLARLFQLLALWSALVTSAFSQPQELILARAYWQDTSAEAPFQTARNKAYTPYENVLNRGYSDSATWVRLTIAASDQPLGLRITPAWLDNITLFDPDRDHMTITVGDRHPSQNNVLPGLGHSFELPAHPSSREVWLKLQTTSSHFLDVQAIPFDQVGQASSRQIITAAMYASVLALILFVLLAIWWVQRDKVLGLYLLRHTVYTYYGAAYLGLPTLLLSAWLPPSFFDLAFSASAIALAPLGIWFDTTLLSRYRPNKILMLLLKSLCVIGIGVLCTFMAGFTREALQSNILVLMVATVVMTLTALSSQPAPSTEQIMPKKVMVTYYLLIFNSLLIGLVNVLGWVPVQSWTQHALIVHGMVSGLMMAGILLVRAQRMANQSRQMTWQLQKAEQEIALEQRRRQEQSQFLHMLMHELKTPLTVVSLALGTQNHRKENLEHASRAIQDMKAIIDRCVQADQLGQLALPQRQQPVNIFELIRQLTTDLPALEQRLRIQMPGLLPPLQTDLQLLQIILNNLLHNADRYSDPLTDVTVTLQPEERKNQHGMVICVRNTTGIAGWPDEKLLFDKYYRAVGAQRESGSGLGLYLSRQLAQSLGGTLDYTPSAQLVEFTLWIPLSPT